MRKSFSQSAHRNALNWPKHNLPMNTDQREQKRKEKENSKYMVYRIPQEALSNGFQQEQDIKRLGVNLKDS